LALAHRAMLWSLGEPIEPLALTFWLLAGLDLDALARFRGFGIAVGGHVSYNLAVTLLVLG